MTTIEPAWLRLARTFDGLAEIPGPTSNPAILKMARDIGAPSWYHNDDQPWCAVFANYVLLSSALPMALGSRGDQFDRLRARTFNDYGQSLAGPAIGAIVVFSRPEGAHVGFYIGEHFRRAPGRPMQRLIRVFGGNQSNRVCATWIGAERLRGVHWPTGIPLPAIGPVWLSADGLTVSTNEA